MKHIIFPHAEHNEIKRAFGAGEKVHTIRYSRDFGRFEVGDILITEWKMLIKVVFSETFQSIREYEFFDRLTQSQKDELLEVGEVRHLILETTTKEN